MSSALKKKNAVAQAAAAAAAHAEDDAEDDDAEDVDLAPQQEHQDDAADDEEDADESHEDFDKSNGSSPAANAKNSAGGSKKVARTRAPGEANGAVAKGQQVVLVGTTVEAMEQRYETLKQIKWPEPGCAIKRHLRSTIMGSPTYGAMFKHADFSPEGDLIPLREKSTGQVVLATLMRTQKELEADYKKNPCHRIRIPTANLLRSNPLIRDWITKNKTAMLDGTKTQLFDNPNLPITKSLLDSLSKPTAPRSAAVAGAPARVRSSKPKPRPASTPAAMAPMDVDSDNEENAVAPSPVAPVIAKPATVALPKPKPKPATAVDKALTASSSRAGGFVAASQAPVDMLLAHDAIAALPKRGEQSSMAQWLAGVGLRMSVEPDVWYANLLKITGANADNMAKLFTSVLAPDQAVEHASKAARLLLSETVQNADDDTVPAFAPPVVLGARAVELAVRQLSQAYSERRKIEARLIENQLDSINSLSLEKEALKADKEELLHQLAILQAAVVPVAKASGRNGKGSSAAGAVPDAAAAAVPDVVQVSKGTKRPAEPMPVEDDVDEANMY